MKVPQGRALLIKVLAASGDVVHISDVATALAISRTDAAKRLARWREQGWLSRVGAGAVCPRFDRHARLRTCSGRRLGPCTRATRPKSRMRERPLMAHVIPHSSFQIDGGVRTGFRVTQHSSARNIGG